MGRRRAQSLHRRHAPSASPAGGSGRAREPGRGASARASAGEARAVRQGWLRLAEPAGGYPAFVPAMLAGLPEPTRRWLCHAIAPGTPLGRPAEPSVRGQTRLGRSRSFTARQVLAPPDGSIWAATARVAGLPVTGFDRLSSGTGQMSWRLLGLLPVVAASGADVTRSACGRLSGEITLLPTAFPQAGWRPGEQAGIAIASLPLAAQDESAELSAGTGGRLLEVR